MHCHYKLFLENNGELVFGPGRVELLQAVKELGSLRKAAAKLGMSYRWAWGRLKDTETSLGVVLLRADPKIGGRSKTLTPEGLALLAWYESMDTSIQQVLRDATVNAPEFLQSALQAADMPK